MLGMVEYIDELALQVGDKNVCMHRHHVGTHGGTAQLQVELVLEGEVVALNFSGSSIQFLDTEIYKVGARLMSILYTKPTDINTLLRYESAHPRNMIRSLPYSQLLCVKKITISI